MRSRGTRVSFLHTNECSIHRIFFLLTSKQEHKATDSLLPKFCIRYHYFEQKQETLHNSPCFSFCNCVASRMRSHCVSRNISVFLAVLCCVSPSAHAWSVGTQTPARADTSLHLFSNIGDIFTGGKLIPQSKLAYGDALVELSNEQRTFAVQEKLFSWTGEDFDVYDDESSNHSPYVRVRGALLHLPGKDKMRIVRGDQIVATLDRKLIALKPTYDIYRGDCEEKIGWIEKAFVSFTDTFDFHAECEKGGVGPFAASPAYKLEGDFLQRNFVMKNARGETVAKVIEDRLIEFDRFDHYQLQVAAGMDPVLVIACACAIDEELEEEHEKKRNERKEKG